MPELPEVETIRRQLENFLVGHAVESVEVINPKIIATRGEDKLRGATIKKVRRFGKILVLDFSNGYSVLIHVKLTGQLIYKGPKLKRAKISKKVFGGAPGPHTHIIFNLDKGGKLYYNDVRRFGWMKLAKTKDVEKSHPISSLGPEATKDLTLPEFTKIVGSTRRTIKTLLLDQSKLSGIGNIYANDALWLAKIDPTRPADKLTTKEAQALYVAIEKVLKEGIKRGGASELAFVTPDGSEGQYQKYFLAYGQNGKVCSRCKKYKIKKIMLSGRGTYFCPGCQH